jgi:hypothetical protein
MTFDPGTGVLTPPGGAVTFPLAAPNGTAPAPSYAFTVSPNTGLFSPTTSQVALSAGGGQRLLATATSVTISVPLTLSGQLSFSPDATYDIGQVGVTRPRDIWLSGNVRANGSGGFGGNVAVGNNTPQTTTQLVVSTGGGTVGTIQRGIQVTTSFSSAALTSGTCIEATFATQAAAFTMANGYGVRIPAPSIGAGSAVTSMFGISISNQGSAGVANAYGMFISLQGSASAVNICLQVAGETVLGQANIVAAATVGFVDICSGANAPTGVPAQVPTGYTAMRFDTTNHKLWFYDAGWKGVVVA